ncbi:hypothetical protein U1Q18_002840 [Sarracenia purpurea var. burkii]
MRAASCRRDPDPATAGEIQIPCALPLEVAKIGIALSHSSVVVSVFSKPDVVSYHSSSSSNLPNSSLEFSDLIGVGGDWLRRVVSRFGFANLRDESRRHRSLRFDFDFLYEFVSPEID